MPEQSRVGHGRTELRRGWTTGACAAAAARAAYLGLICGHFPDPVEIPLPRGGTARFSLALAEGGGDRARAGVVKDAGDDPDVTDGALVIAELARAGAGSGLGFAAGEGVGTVTRAGLPLAVGEPAINPGPRRMIRAALDEAAAELGLPPPDATVTISIPGGAVLAAKTMNARLGIVGGLSILGTSGVVIPYSCAAWVHAIRRGIDVARAAGLAHIAAATGTVSERAVQRLYDLPEHALIDMGDFVGGMLKYLRRHPLPRLTIAGGFGKLAKLAQGDLDLHSAKSRLDPAFLARVLAGLGADARLLRRAEETAAAGEILDLAGGMGTALAEEVAARARAAALAELAGDTAVEIAVVGRDGRFLARVGI